MPQNVWTLNANNISGGSDGQKLAGCHIVQNGDTYQFTKPNINDVLATVGPPLPTSAFPFPAFHYKDVDNWGIGSNPLVPGQNALGSWFVDADQQSGTYTAVYDADEAASSAKA